MKINVNETLHGFEFNKKILKSIAKQTKICYTILDG